MDLGLKGAAVCVQGGSRGMGRAAADCFAREGARVAVLARGQESLDKAVAELKALGAPDAIGLVVDLEKPETIEAAFATIGERWGELNALVNAAGPDTCGKPWYEIDDATWFRSFTIGTMGAIRCARAALPLLRKAEWARIVNLSAMSAKHQSRGLADYTVAKVALNSVSKNMAMELAPEGILVNIVSPGPFLSDNLAAYIAAESKGSVDLTDLKAVGAWITERFKSSTQLGRVGHPDEIGPAIVFAASRLSTYMTGANINIDGGSHFQ